MGATLPRTRAAMRPTRGALADAGVVLHTLSRIEAFDGNEATLVNVFTSARPRLPCRALVIVGARLSNDDLYRELTAQSERLVAAGIASVTRVGDALAPGAIAHAVYSGHLYGREFDAGEPARILRRDGPVRTVEDAPESA